MINSILIRVEKDPFIPIRKSYIKICKDNINAACLLAIFEHWTNIKTGMKQQISIENKIRKIENLPNITSNIWIYKTYENLIEDSLGQLNRHDVKEGLDLLINLKFLEKRRNPKYKWDKTLQYKLNADLINHELSIVHIGTIDSSYRDDGSSDGELTIPEITTKTTTIESKDKSFANESEGENICSEILTYWNTLASEIKELSKHKSLNSHCQIAKDITPTLREIISNTLKLYNSDLIKEAIKNYIEVLSSDKYYYDYNFKTLGKFLASDKGISKFLNSVNPKTIFLKSGSYASDSIFDKVRKEINLVNYQYDKQNILNKEEHTYMGYQTELINTYDVKSTVEEIELHIRRGTFGKSYYQWLEECIITLIFRKEDEELLKKLYKMHIKLKL